MAQLRIVRPMKHGLLIPLLIAAFLVSCDDGPGVSVWGEGYVAGFTELDGRVHAVTDKSFYPAMEIAVRNGDFSTLGYPYEDEPWFVLADGDRIGILEVDEDEAIAHVEVFSGFHAGTTCWVSLDCVKHD